MGSTERVLLERRVQEMAFDLERLQRRRRGLLAMIGAEEDVLTRELLAAEERLAELAQEEAV